MVRRGVREARGWRGISLPTKKFPASLPRRRVHKDVADQMLKAQGGAARGPGKDIPRRPDRVVAIAADSWRSGT